MNDLWLTINSFQSQFRLADWLATFTSMAPPMVLLIQAAGIIFLLYGRPVFKFAVALNAAIVAAWFGWQVGQKFDMPIAMACIFGVIFGILAWPAVRFGVAMITGAVGATLIGTLMSIVLPQYMSAAPIVSIVAGVAFAMVGVFLVEPAVLAFTAIQGSTMIVLSCTAILHHVLEGHIDICESASQRPAVVFITIAALAALGAMYQATPRKRDAAPADDGPPKDAG